MYSFMSGFKIQLNDFEIYQCNSVYHFIAKFVGQFHNVFIQSPVDGHLNYFQFEAVFEYSYYEYLCTDLSVAITFHNS